MSADRRSALGAVETGDSHWVDFDHGSHQFNPNPMPLPDLSAKAPAVHTPETQKTRRQRDVTRV